MALGRPLWGAAWGATLAPAPPRSHPTRGRLVRVDFWHSWGTPAGEHASGPVGGRIRRVCRHQPARWPLPASLSPSFIPSRLSRGLSQRVRASAHRSTRRPSPQFNAIYSLVTRITLSGVTARQSPVPLDKKASELSCNRLSRRIPGR